MVIVFAVIHVLEPWVIFEPHIVEFCILSGCGAAFVMGVEAVWLTLVNPEAIMRRLSDFDLRNALLADVNLAHRFDVFRTESGHRSAFSRLMRSTSAIISACRDCMLMGLVLGGRVVMPTPALWTGSALP